MSILRKSRILCIVMILALVATVIAPIGSFTAFAGDVGTYGDFTYAYSCDEITILEYNGSGGDVVIPSTIDGYPVVGVESEAFFDNDTITSVSMPSVLTIGDSAFESCDNLVSVSMPSVVTIGEYAFDSCHELTTADMPNVETISYEAFDYCYKLENVDILKVTTIDTYAFYECYALTEFNAPNVVSLGNSVFYGCESLVSIDLPKVLFVDADTFKYCYALESVNLPSVEIIGETAFYDCSSLEKIIMPNVHTIYYAAFSGCPSSMTIYGYSGTFAETFANERGFNFSPMSVWTVTLNNDGAVTTQTVADGQCAAEPEEPEKDGQYFLGWYTEGGEYFYFDTPITEDITLYAKFGYYVAICLDGEPVGWMPVVAGECALEPEAPGKEGKVFVGWYTAGGTKYDFSTPVTANISIYAKFVDESVEWVKSVSHVITDGKIIFTVVTAPGVYNRVKLAADDDRGGYIAYTNTYAVNSDGDYVWTIKAAAPTSATTYAFDLRSSATGKYMKDYGYYDVE